MNNRIKRQRKLQIWALATFLGLMAGTFAQGLLWVALHPFADGEYSPDIYVLGFYWVLLSGALQGTIIVIFQGIALKTLALTKLNTIRQRYLITIFAMPLGRALPFLIGLQAESLYFGGLVLSWSLAGLLLGLMGGHHRQQKIQFSLLNTAAYTLWGIAQMFFIVMCILVLDPDPVILNDYLRLGLGLAITFAGGIGLNRIVLLRSKLLLSPTSV